MRTNVTKTRLIIANYHFGSKRSRILLNIILAANTHLLRAQTPVYVRWFEVCSGLGDR
jgi:hypothetical protein